MGLRLARAKFPTLVNPHGTLFNPLSILNSLQRAHSSTPPPEWGYIEQNHNHLHLDYHGSIHADTRESLHQKIIQLDKTLGEALRTTTWLIVTFGTAWVYRYQGREIITNCHRLPGTQFTRERIHPDEITQQWSELIDTLRSTNPYLRILLTVSPVRHLRDGMRENATSKAALLLSAESLTQNLPNVYYFPAFEILTDELRDYRFYADDLIHPAPIAEAIIWKRLQQLWMDAPTRQLIEQIESLQCAIAHENRSGNPHDFLTHLNRTQKRLDALQAAHPHLDFSEERALLAKQRKTNL